MKKIFMSEISQHSCQPNSLEPHLSYLMSPAKVEVPAKSHCVLTGSLTTHVLTESPRESVLLFTLPIFFPTTYFCKCLIKSDVWNMLSKPTYSLVCVYFLWNSLRSKWTRCLFLLQFTTASNFYWAVKSNTITSITSITCEPRCLFIDNFIA